MPNSLKMKSIKFIIALLFTVHQISAQNAVLRQKHFNTEKNLAISGYDPVSYFSGKPLEGLKALSFTVDGITYRFATAKNLELFKKNPASYEPQYGGWCAYAMGSSGEKVEVDPETFKIINGKLYLYYNKFFNNTLSSWNKNEAVLKAKADANWIKIYH
ncbi:hypothetical protein BH11BAC2_BH11BAC2_19770 [soil metagenome]